MSDFEIRVVGAKPPRKPDGPLRRFRQRVGAISRRILMRPRRIILIGIAGYVLTVGTPHIGWDYQCLHPMNGPGSCRYIDWCAYYGIQGRRIETPPDGQQCSLVKALPIDWGRIIGRD